MKPIVLILHCWEWKPEDNWYNSVKLLLEKLWYKVIIPILPNTYTPNLDEQLLSLKPFKDSLNEDSIVIWHSLWWQLASFFVSSLDKKIKSIIMVAPTYPWVANDMKISTRQLNDSEKAFIKYTDSKVDFSKIIQNTDFQIIHISEDDPYIIFDTVKMYYSDIKNLKIHTYKNKNHFNWTSWIFNFPEILIDIDKP